MTFLQARILKMQINSVAVSSLMDKDTLTMYDHYCLVMNFSFNKVLKKILLVQLQALLGDTDYLDSGLNPSFGTELALITLVATFIKTRKKGVGSCYFLCRIQLHV